MPSINKAFFDKHPEIIIEKKSDSPDEDKSVHDTRLLIPTFPTLQDLFAAHPLLNPATFLGDAAFDSSKLYRELLSGDTFGIDANGNSIHFQKAYIPLNHHGKPENKDYSVNQDGIPCCPNDPSLPMKPDSTSKRRNGIIRYKFSCPKIKWEKNPSTGKYRRVCHCENPCTPSPSGRMVYIYLEKDLRTYPGTLRGTAEWEDTYKIRTTVERSINHFKSSFGLAGRKTQNEKTLHTDLLLAGITQLIGVILADKIDQHQYIRSLKPLIA